MASEFLCEATRMEFELGYPDTAAGGQYHPHASPRDHNWAANRGISKSQDLGHEIPWQNIGSRTGQWDPYQKYTMDTRFVPDEYKELVEHLQQSDSDLRSMQDLLPGTTLGKEYRTTHMMDVLAGQSQGSKTARVTNGNEAIEHAEYYKTLQHDYANARKVTDATNVLDRILEHKEMKDEIVNANEVSSNNDYETLTDPTANVTKVMDDDDELDVEHNREQEEKKLDRAKGSTHALTVLKTGLAVIGVVAVGTFVFKRYCRYWCALIFSHGNI